MSAIIRVSSVADGNMALHTATDADSRAAALLSRRRFLAECGMDPARLVVGEQIHGATVREVGEDDAGRGANSAGHALPGTDGLVTRASGIPLMVLGADCAILCLHDPAGSAIAVVHAGWRGLVAGVLEAALATLAPRDPERLEAYLGPAAGRCCYEVGEDVARHFPSEALVRIKGQPRPNLDIRRAVEVALGRPVEPLGAACTICDPTCFSHRRDGTAARQALIAMLA